MENKPATPENENEEFEGSSQETNSQVSDDSAVSAQPDEGADRGGEAGHSDDSVSEEMPSESAEGEPGDVAASVGSDAGGSTGDVDVQAGGTSEGSENAADDTPAAEGEKVESDGSVDDEEAVEPGEEGESVSDEDFDADALGELAEEGFADSGDESELSDEEEKITATAASFKQLKEENTQEIKNNITMLLDISLPIVVELGRTRMLIEDILNLHVGSVIALDKIAGEPANIVVNNKVMAKGEVVVIDENFGIRITSLLSPVDRLQGLK
jgi:flagellar motor switch protein FliN